MFDALAHLGLRCAGQGRVGVPGIANIVRQFRDLMVVELLVKGGHRQYGRRAGLGAVTAGTSALLPLLEFGKKKSRNCAALMS